MLEIAPVTDLLVSFNEHFVAAKPVISAIKIIAIQTLLASVVIDFSTQHPFIVVLFIYAQFSKI